MECDPQYRPELTEGPTGVCVCASVGTPPALARTDGAREDPHLPYLPSPSLPPSTPQPPLSSLSHTCTPTHRTPFSQAHAHTPLTRCPPVDSLPIDREKVTLAARGEGKWTASQSPCDAFSSFSPPQDRKEGQKWKGRRRETATRKARAIHPGEHPVFPVPWVWGIGNVSQVTQVSNLLGQRVKGGVGVRCTTKTWSIGLND